MYENIGDISKIYKEYNYLSQSTIRNYLNKGTEIGWCNYDGKQNQLNASRKNGRKNAKEIVIFNNDNKYICTWNGVADFSKNSINIIGIKTCKDSISDACKSGKPYKGFYYKFKSDISEADYLEMIK